MDANGQPWFGFSYYAYVPSELELEDRDGSLRRRLFTTAWELIPDDLKPYSRMIPFFIGSAEGFLSFGGASRQQIRREILELSDQHAIPIHPYIRMAFDRNCREWHADMEVPLGDLERMFGEHEHLLGVHIGEMAGEAGFFAEERAYLMRTIELAARYGKTVSLWDHANLWQVLLLDEEFVDLIRRCPKTFVPLWETNGAKTAYADQGMPFGLWASGLVERWGVNPQAGWYWFESGFREMWSGRSMSGSEAKAPDVLWSLMSALGASAGAQAYFFEGTEGWFWNFRGKFNESADAEWDPDVGSIKKVKLPQTLDLTETFKRAIHPTLKRLLEPGAIPTRQQVLEQVKVIYRTKWLPDDTTPVWNPEMFRRMSWATGMYDDLATLPSFWSLPAEQKKFYMGHLYPATYGVTHGSDLVPKTSRYYWIPVVSKYADPSLLPPDKLVVESGQFKKEDEAKRFFDQNVPRQDSGSAWVACVGRSVYVFNRHENQPVDDEFHCRIGGFQLSGRIPALAFLLATDDGTGLSIYVNNFIGVLDERQMEIQIRSPRPFEVSLAPADIRSDVKTSPDHTTAEFRLTFNGSAELRVAVC
ncbi:MAG: hypothetical protein GXY33_19585 [Phycisphaerae bacterium]|mgnify:CR=1 FL=1|nr:hypothetical protein [Phycisphaerae bacterium]